MCAYQPQSTCVWQGVALRAYSGVRMMAYLRPRALSRYLVQVSLTSNGVWAYVGVRRRAYGPAAVYGRVPAPANDHINKCASVRPHTLTSARAYGGVRTPTYTCVRERKGVRQRTCFSVASSMLEQTWFFDLLLLYVCYFCLFFLYFCFIFALASFLLEC